MLFCGSFWLKSFCGGIVKIGGIFEGFVVV